MNPSDAAHRATKGSGDARSTAPTSVYLSWPPPGLEAIHGKLSPLIALLIVGDGVLVLPLLAAVGTEQEFWSLGLFGRAWWIPVVTTIGGVMIVIAGFERLVRLLWLGGAAARHGHRWLTIIEAAADATRDTGFLLQGARVYADMAAAERRTILVARMVGTAASLAATLWMPLGFAVAVLLASRGWLDVTSIWLLTLALPAVLGVLATSSSTGAYILARSGRRDRQRRLDVEEELRRHVSVWNARFEPARHDLALPAGAGGSGRMFRLSAIAAIAIAVLIVSATVVLAVSGAVGPVVASVAVPNLASTQARLAAADVFRAYRLEPDPAITALAAGEALRALMAVGSIDRPGFAVKPPPRTYDGYWLPVDSAGVVGAAPREWAIELLGRARSGVQRREREYLQAVAAHPAHGEFAIAARAAAADIIGTRYILPFPDSLAPIALPMPRLRGIHDGAIAHVAAAALDLAAGRIERAELAIREVISIGFLLLDEGATVIDNLIGAALIDLGGDALVALHGATGRQREAADLARVRTAVEQVARRAASPGAAPRLDQALRAIPALIGDTTTARGVRWESFTNATTFAPCLNLNRMIFGPGQAYATWLEDARRVLVRRPSEEALFQFAQRGLSGTGDCGAGLGGLRRVARID